MGEETTQAREIEMTRDDLNAEIRKEVQSALREGLSNEKTEDHLRGLVREILGAEQADKVAETRDKAKAAWDALPGAEQLRSFKRSVLGGDVAQERLADNDPKTGRPAIGRGLYFAEYVMHHTRLGGFGGVLRMAKSDDGNMSPGLRAIIRQLTPDTIAGGGAFVPDVLAADFINFLYARTLLRALGSPMVLDISAGNLTIPRGGNSTAVSWIGTTDTIPNTDPTFEQVTLTAKKLGGRVRMSNDLVRRADQNSVAIVRNDLMRIMALAEDIAGIRGDGTANQPTGIRFEAGVTVTGSAGTTLANKVTDLLGAQQRLHEGNVPLDEPAWLMSVRTEFGLKQTLTSDEAFFFLPEMAGGTLLGDPFGSTTQIPTNLGGGSDESEITYYETTQLMIGETLRMEVREAEADDDFARDLRTVRGIHEVDFRLRNPEAAEVINAVLY